MDYSSPEENRLRKQFVRTAGHGSLLLYRLALYSMAVLFSAAGLTKLARIAFVMDAFDAWGLPSWIVPLVGAAELGGALLLALSRHAYLGALILSFVMTGAAITHLVNGEVLAAIVPLALLGGLGNIVYQQSPKPTWWLPEKNPRDA
jgi:uncharacterized membrane protein YphA (DoxX/SURF4 family)